MKYRMARYSSFPQQIRADLISYDVTVLNAENVERRWSTEHMRLPRVGFQKLANSLDYVLELTLASQGADTATVSIWIESPDGEVIECWCFEQPVVAGDAFVYQLAIEMVWGAA